MGSGSSKREPSPVVVPDDVSENWDSVESAASSHSRASLTQINRRFMWKTVRVFVASTFKDFHSEREILHKEVFPEIQAFCEQRRVHFEVCDLLWGIPDDCRKDQVLRACLEEIDRGFQYISDPYYIHMIGGRLGWIPTKNDIEESLREHFGWVDGMSMTEMEAVYGAYRTNNTNALFMIRNPDFLENVPLELHSMFTDSNIVNQAKLDVFRAKLRDRFPSGQIIDYTVQFGSYDEDEIRVKLDDLETFSDVVRKRLKSNIDHDFPFQQISNSVKDYYAEKKAIITAYTLNLGSDVIGMNEGVNQLLEYIRHENEMAVPAIVSGHPGCGKSTVLGLLTRNLLENQMPNTQLFYHFTGASACSANIEEMLKRFIFEYYEFQKQPSPENVDIGELVSRKLSSQTQHDIVIIIDDISKFSEERPHPLARQMTWLPNRLSSKVKVIISVSEETRSMKILRKRYPLLHLVNIEPISDESKEAIIRKCNEKLNLNLPEELIFTFAEMDAADNPLWLATALQLLLSQELEDLVAEWIRALPTDTVQLQVMQLGRLKDYEFGNLVQATLCYLETQRTGLLELEIRTLLSDDEEPLAAYKWALVYNTLSPFLRPCNAFDQGRLEFSQKSFSAAIRKVFFEDDADDVITEVQGEENVQQAPGGKVKAFHRELALFFEQRCDRLDRKVESLPRHFIALNEYSKLRQFIAKWETFEAMFDPYHSTALLKLWQVGSDEQRMIKTYSEHVKLITKRLNLGLPDDREKLAKANFMIGCLCFQIHLNEKAEEFFVECVDAGDEYWKTRAEIRLCDMSLLKYMELRRVQDHQSDSSKEAEIGTIVNQITILKQVVRVYESLSSQKEINDVLRTNQAVAYHGLADQYATYLEYSDDYPELTDTKMARDAQAGALAKLIKASKIYVELGDLGSHGLVLNSKGLMKEMPWFENKIKETPFKLYTEAEGLVCKHFSPSSPSLLGIYRNIVDHARLSEDPKVHAQAFDHLNKWLNLNIDLFGPNGLDTKETLAIFSEPWMKNLKK